MNKILTMIGASAIALGVMSEGAEAKKVFYEINGQRYSYDTNNPEQVVAARKRIEAANAADAAKAKADAERAGNPLVSVFGSQAQREATEAKARVEQLIAEQGQAAAIKRQRPSQAAGEERRKKQAEEQGQNSADKQAERQDASTEQEGTAPAAAPRSASPPDSPVDPANPRNTSKPTLKSVSFDVESGIKTVIMTDGSIHEEPFDSSVLSKLVSEQGGGNSLTAYVDQLRKGSAAETTGSTISGAARPTPDEEPPSSAQLRP